jgi:DNA-binding NarL/FixJ family response regulator
MISVAAHAETNDTEPGDAARHHMRLLVVDDHPAVRAGLRGLLADEPGFEVIDAVGSAEEAMSVAEREPIDVAVVDYQLGSRNGLWLTRKLKRLQPPPAVVIYSAYADSVLAAAAVVADADAVVSKGSLGSRLCDEIRLVGQGGRSRLAPLPGWLAETVRSRFDDEEQAIFGMLLAGIGAGEIARMLGLSMAGLDSRLGAMLRRLEAPQSDQPGAREDSGRA